MRKRRQLRRPATLASLALVIALASLGFGYAAWSEQLTISGEVQTARIGLTWTLPGDNQAFACIDLNDVPGDWAHTTMRRDATDPKLMHVEVDNGFPGYKTKCGPLEWSVDADSLPLSSVGLELNNIAVTSGETITLDLNGDSIDDVKIRLINAPGGPVPPNAFGSSNIEIEVLPGAPPGTTLSFTGELIFELYAP